ncbi:MAG: hypothetical protein VKJ04_11950 [Vampirovibrionales bacterium]|nr:hypothetical protein [Vampirovibrionales bacterium]
MGLRLKRDMPNPIVPRQVSGFLRGWPKALGLAFMLSLTFLPLSTQSAAALVKVMDAESVNMAIKYGIKKQDAGFAAILGPNWIEGENGTLLNVYTPFMMIATQASKKGVETISDSDVKAVKKRMARMLSRIQDPRTPQEVKFSVAMYGDRPNFGKDYTATIEGEGRGKSVRLTPIRALPDAIANTNPDETVYEAINTYYFKFSDLENLDNFTLILKSPQDEKTFTVHVNDIY